MLKFPTIVPSSKVDGIVTWKDGTDAQIAKMIQMADAGLIDLSDYWSIGDERTVHLNAMTADNNAFTSNIPAQDVTLVLMNEGYPDVIINGTTYSNAGVHYVIGQKDCLSVGGRMNSTASNSGSWNDSKMWTSLNTTYLQAFPTTFYRDVLKVGRVATTKTYNGTDLQQVGARVALFAEKEIFGERTYSNATEAAALTQIEYYKTAANLIKQVNGSNYSWWERSPYSSDGSYFCNVTSNGSAGGSNASSTRGIAPMMFI